MSDSEDVRILGISAAFAFVALNAFVVLGFLLAFFSALENRYSALGSELQISELMVGVSVLLFALAIATFIGVVKDRRSSAMRAFAYQIACSVLALGYALHGSSHSDGKLAVFALSVELTGFAAVTLGCGPTMQPADH